MQCHRPVDPRVVEHRALARRRRAWPLSGVDEARYATLTRELVRELLRPDEGSTPEAPGTMQGTRDPDDPAP